MCINNLLRNYLRKFTFISSFTKLFVKLNIYLFLVLICSLLIYVKPVSAVSTQPQACRIGVYLVGLNDFDLAKKSFHSDFWVWSVCPSQDLKPLNSLDFIDAKKVDTAYDSILEKKDNFGEFKQENKVYWSQKKVDADFYHHWNVQNFPFDRHTLKIPIEEAIYDASAFVYLPDTKNSSYKKDIQLEGWNIDKFSIKEDKINYDTTYGDPELENGQSKYSRVTISIDIRRNSIISFFKLHAVVYIGFIVSLASYFLNPAQTSLMSGKISAPVGSLFAVVVNQRAAESILGRTEQLSLVDKIHITAMTYILISIIIAVYSRVISERGNEKLALRMNYNCAYVFGISFIIFNIVLIAQAAIAG